MKRSTLLKVFIVIFLLFINVLDINANNDFDYEININNNVVEIDNANIKINDIYKIDINYPDYLTYKDSYAPKGWVFIKNINQISIDTSLNNSLSEVKNYLDSVSFDVTGAIVDNQITITLYFKKPLLVQQGAKFYKFVDAPNMTWFEAYKAAKESTYNNMQGYLATVIDDNERQELEKVSTKIGWLGGTRAVNATDGNIVSDPDASLYTVDVKTCDKVVCPWQWYWADGPEKGNVFFDGPTHDTGSNTGYEYFYKDASGYYEPNNAGEVEAFLSSKGSNNAYWNDLPNSGVVEGYFIKYSSDFPETDSISVSKAIKPAPIVNPPVVTPPISQNPEPGSIVEETIIYEEIIEENLVEEEIKPKIEKEKTKKEDKEALAQVEEKIDQSDSVSITLISNETLLNVVNKSTVNDSNKDIIEEIVTNEKPENKKLFYEKLAFSVVFSIFIIQQVFHKYMLYKLKKGYKK